MYNYLALALAFSYRPHANVHIVIVLAILRSSHITMKDYEIAHP